MIDFTLSLRSENVILNDVAKISRGCDLNIYVLYIYYTIYYM